MRAGRATEGGHGHDGAEDIERDQGGVGRGVGQLALADEVAEAGGAWRPRAVRRPRLRRVYALLVRCGEPPRGCTGWCSK